MNSVQLRQRLVSQLRSTGVLTDAAVADAFLTVPRERFLTDVRQAEGLARVYRDDAIPTRWESGIPTSSSSQPAIMAVMLEALDVRPGHRVLEIGLGTGYNAALLTRLVGPTGRVFSVDNQPDCVRDAAAHLDGYGVSTLLGDGYEGWPEEGPFDRVIVTASVDGCPRSWWEQLVPDGVLVAPMRFTDPLDMQAVVTLRRSGSGFQSIGVTAGGFMALRRAGDPPYTPRAALAASDSTEAPHRSLVHIWGPGPRGLDSAARTRLLAFALSPAASRTRTASGSFGVIWHLQLSVPTPRLVFAAGEAVGQRAVGLTDRAGRGLSLLATHWGPGGVTMRSLNWGALGCREELRRHILAWRRMGKPDADRLDIAVAYRDLDHGTAHRAGKTVTLPDQTIHVRWRP